MKPAMLAFVVGSFFPFFLNYKPGECRNENFHWGQGWTRDIERALQETCTEVWLSNTDFQADVTFV